MVSRDLSARKDMSPRIQQTSRASRAASQVGTVPLFRYTDCINFHCRIHTDFQGHHRELHEPQRFARMPVTSTADFPVWKQPEVVDLTRISSIAQFLQILYSSFSGLFCFHFPAVKPNFVLLDLRWSLTKQPGHWPKT